MILEVKLNLVAPRHVLAGIPGHSPEELVPLMNFDGVRVAGCLELNPGINHFLIVDVDMITVGIDLGRRFLMCQPGNRPG